MRSLLFANAFFLSFVQAVLASPTDDGLTVDEVRRSVAEGYAKQNRFRMSCAGYAGPESIIVALDFRFDRRAKRLAIGSLGEDIPSVLVKGNQLFVSLGFRKDDVPTYLEIKKDRPITWKDIDGATQLIRKQFGSSGGWIGSLPFSTTCGSFGVCFVAPFLEGGVEQLLPQDAKVLHVDRKWFNLAQSEAGARIAEAGNPGVEFFWVGHPDYALIHPIGEERPKLDPNRFPICFKTEDDSSTWLYAFDPQTGTLCAAMGTVDHERVCGSPGNKITIMMKKTPFLGDGEAGTEDEGVDPIPPIPLELPRDAKTIGIGDVRRYYVEVMSQLGLAKLLEAKAEMKQDLQKGLEEESNLVARISEESAISPTEQEHLEDLRAELAIVRGKMQTYRHVIAEYEKLITEIQEGTGDKGCCPSQERGRVAPGDCSPGAPTDPDVQDYRIRFLK